MENGSFARAPGTLLPAALVALLSVTLGAVMLGHKSLWFDEAFDAQAVRGTWSAIVHLVRATEMSQGAYLVALKSWSALAGTGEVALRVPSVAAAALAAALLVPLGSRIFDLHTGVIAGVLLALNAFVVQWAQQARAYAAVTLAVVAATLLFVRALDDGRRLSWALYAVVAALSVYLHFYAGFVLVAHAASLPFVSRRPPARTLLAVAAAVTLLVLPALYFTATAGRSQLGWIAPVTVDRVWNVTVNSTGRNVVLGVAAMTGLAVLAFRIGAGSRPDRWRAMLVGGWAAFPIALGVVTSFVQPIVVPRYAIVITPALALLAAHSITTLAAARPSAAIALLAAIVVVAGVRITQWYAKTPEDWRGAVAYVQAHRTPADAIAVTPAWAVPAFRYYDADSALGTTSRSGRTFVVVRTGKGHERVSGAEGVIGTGLRLLEQHPFGRAVTVQLWGSP